MQDFTFHNPAKILFGHGRLEQIGAEVAQLGSRALLVFGRKHALTSGLIDHIDQLLITAGVTPVHFGGAVPNPLLSHVRQGIDLAGRQQVDVIVGLGGGSSMDTAKAIAAGYGAKHDVWKFFNGKKSLKSTLPVVLVPTLAGSGSEMNNGMVLTHDKRGEKFGFGHRLLFPRVSILDPALTYSTPPHQTACGATDIIAHVLEFYLTTGEQAPVQDRLIEGIVCSVMAACEKCLAAPEDYEARAALLWCSSLALSGLPAAGLGRVGFPMHLIAHSLGALYNLPHGSCLSMVMPGWLTWRRSTAPERIADLGRKIFFPKQAPPSTLSEQADLTITLLTAWLAKIGMPTTLGQTDIAADQFALIADNTKGLARSWRLKEYPFETVMDILKHCA
ncbi:MAG: NADH-dependent alcohol dehydrogenase [Desulfobulbus propionicus]|nr:MAG: NADH-dependent alcohol dehydrogenase [Desulfobulbus propionicus]